MSNRTWTLTAHVDEENDDGVGFSEGMLEGVSTLAERLFRANVPAVLSLVDTHGTEMLQHDVAERLASAIRCQHCKDPIGEEVPARLSGQLDAKPEWVHLTDNHGRRHCTHLPDSPVAEPEEAK